jgi:Zn-dependent peptidase ImmA (M78 family)
MGNIEKNQMIKNSSLIVIKHLAESIALEFSNIITPLDLILEEEELDLFYDSYGDSFDGMTIYDKSQFFIHLNTYRGNRPNTPRSRFTIAHELGHYFIDNHRIGLKKGLLSPHPSINNENAHFRIEREADYFASCLLMPEERFKKFIQRKKFEFSVIRSLSEHFQTSITATAIRFADIGNHPLMIVFGEKGKIKWRWNSEDFPFKYLLYNDKIPENSVMGEYFTNGRLPNETEEVCPIDWFNFIKEDDETRKFKEHCIPHKYLALSIIWEV